ncbi:MAG TPA: UDP-2,4-diacetamido-2,4,6-trideoxy-beta-L-altropyranose hydrolase [Candidatus Eisenbergiella intestinipullorum]|nr:UDP-2,4-diacetamido-2,4,6-trideoxy-beta-L-altropyranose hydrolase [Candidatus Eisenbergiella intestinipullorum]
MGTAKTVLIRTDGNPDIATGHLMRCLSIACALRELGAQAEFAVSDEISRRLLFSFFEEEPFPVHVLHSDFRRPESELPSLKKLLLHGPSCLLIDSYFITQPYLEALRPLIPTAYLDDLCAFDYPVDLVINYDFAPPADFYRLAGKKLLGCRYTPLRAQFSGLSPVSRPPDSPVRDLFVSTGGTDDRNAAGKLASALLSAPESASWRIHALIGPMHVHREELQVLAASHPRLILHENVKDMAGLMRGCDLAVSAAGTTLYELCAAGVAAVSFTMADNQLSCAMDMERFAGVPCAGDVRSTPDLTGRLLSLLFSLAENPEKRKRLSRSMHAAIDGKGAERIAGELLAL